MQSLYWLYSFAPQNKIVSKRFHGLDPDSTLQQNRQDLILKASEVRVHDIERHLYRVETKVIFRCNIQHSKVNERVFVSGKADVTDLTRFSGLQHCFLSSALAKDAVGILRTNHFVMLEEIDVIGLKSFQ